MQMPLFVRPCLTFVNIFLQYRIRIRTTKWWKHLAIYVVPVSILSVVFNIPMFFNLKVCCIHECH